MPREIERTEKEKEKSPQMHPKLIQEAVVKGMASPELEKLAAEGLQIVHVGKGFVRCNFIVSARVSDGDGKWHAGAIATIMDIIGSIAMYSATATTRAKVTTDYNISYYSSAKIQEEVEIESKVIGNRGKLTSFVVEIKRKDDGELIAIGKQWTVSNNFKAPWDLPSRL
ncbi:hypothetical protein REPUB_Repub13aG0172300 [Reevesia pubescens]